MAKIECSKEFDGKWTVRVVTKFSEHYHEEFDSCWNYVLDHKNGQDALARFSEKKYGIKLTSYSLTYDGNDPYVFSRGFEIEDDEALTAFLLKENISG